MNILVVDDNEASRRLLRVVLTAEGHGTVEASNGLEALDWLNRESFDVLISEVLMPGMDGYRLCCEVRRSESFHSLPIIIYSSAYMSETDEQAALKAGADRFLSKLALPAVVLETLKEVSRAPRFRLAPISAPILEPEILREYSEKLVWELEEKNLQLVSAQKQLVEANEELSQANEALERDVYERKRVEEQVKHLAFHDGLTGLPNRALFNDRLTVALTHARRHGTKLAILFLDLDRFKQINDSLGHAVGDELLRQVAQRLHTCVREEDTLARLGGDEFILLVTTTVSEDDATVVARKVLGEIRKPFLLDGRELFVTTSVGVSQYPSDGHDVDSLIRSADAAMYRAKEKGRDSFQICRPGMSVMPLELLRLENRLRQALNNDEFLLHYQPIVDLRHGQIQEVEALLRWQTDRGLVGPRDFIPVAENTGLIIPLSQWVLKSACAQAVGSWSNGQAPLTVAVNLSAQQFQQTDLVEDVTRSLEETGLPATSLAFEITETSAMQNVERSASTLRRLKDLGAHVSLDDFGTGFSSLSYLRRLPIDRIKIDHSFVQGVTSDPDDAAIVSAVIAMAHQLRLTVVAEGVETEAQLAFLRAQNCDQAQGFLLSPPLAAPEVEELLKESEKPTSPIQRFLANEKPPRQQDR